MEPQEKVNNTGNVGFGTTRPNYPLDVNGDAQVRGRMGVEAGVYSDPEYSLQVGKSVLIRRGLETMGNVAIGGGIDSSIPLTVYGKEKVTGDLIVQGNVGIGTAAPEKKLDVNGDVIVRSSLTVQDDIWLASDKTLRSPGNMNIQAFGGQLSLNPWVGNVGVGTPAPAAKLDVNGHAAIRGSLYLGKGVGDYRIQTDAPDHHYPGHHQLLALRAYEYWPWGYEDRTVLVPAYAGFRITDRDNANINLGLDNNGNLSIRGTYWPASDSRMKANQEPLNYGLAEVLKLQPKRYDHAKWEYDPETEEIVIHPETTTNTIGLLAQDVQKVIPEAVSVPENENSQVWSLSYDTIIPVLVKAIQEQQAQIEELKQEIQAIKNGI